MKIDIICVGKLKEDYLTAAQKEYLKRLTPYGRFTVHEVSEGTLEKEAAALEKILPSGAYKIAMAIKGASLSSERFAEKLRMLAVDGMPHAAFIIGGSDGLDERILKICDAHISLSAMTFTHQIARILLLEQVYRAFRIINNQPYHK